MEEFLKELEAIKDQFKWSLEQTKYGNYCIRGYAKIPIHELCEPCNHIFCPITAVYYNRTNIYLMPYKTDYCDVGLEVLEKHSVVTQADKYPGEIRNRMLEILGLQEISDGV